MSTRAIKNKKVIKYDWIYEECLRNKVVEWYYAANIYQILFYRKLYMYIHTNKLHKILQNGNYFA